MSDTIYDIIFRVAEVLELPVVILTLLALAAALVEVGAFIAEMVKRRGRTFASLAKAGASARRAVDEKRFDEASALLQTVAWSAPVGKAFRVLVDAVSKPGADTRIAKELADFDFGRQARLSRTRLLVRLGPALGLMGTLIPLAPALDGLARGDVDALTENLRLAFSITVLGILIGVIALALSLFRERRYGQDFSDLEYVAAILTDDGSAAASIGTSATTSAPPAPPVGPTAPSVSTTAPVPSPSSAPTTTLPPLVPPAKDAGSPS
ncbi:MotA/TolQ/ExbB proton channel family protein [Aeromicrobium sp. CFBP 8757]|uniref:MotA/TolQ/ExbB proton channel family protein n=1 Tax=Aeromicrobium sp. CFBP 8757 TaxID=2775288 RepID=UPI001780E2BB|nr:MotA/TolQ/ExbB proton channel family protein [Aeromicrobium sp. CFBP 8757]MBD8607996.1 MotA/TolQ/ExbB proton channel family protein [Aeromicrobium sp. CFBP 8757]